MSRKSSANNASMLHDHLYLDATGDSAPSNTVAVTPKSVQKKIPKRPRITTLERKVDDDTRALPSPSTAMILQPNAQTTPVGVRRRPANDMVTHSQPLAITNSLTPSSGLHPDIQKLSIVQTPLSQRGVKRARRLDSQDFQETNPCLAGILASPHPLAIANTPSSGRHSDSQSLSAGKKSARRKSLRMSPRQSDQDLQDRAQLAITNYPHTPSSQLHPDIQNHSTAEKSVAQKKGKKTKREEDQEFQEAIMNLVKKNCQKQEENNRLVNQYVEKVILVEEELVMKVISQANELTAKDEEIEKLKEQNQKYLERIENLVTGKEELSPSIESDGALAKYDERMNPTRREGLITKDQKLQRPNQSDGALVKYDDGVMNQTRCVRFKTRGGQFGIELVGTTISEVQRGSLAEIMGVVKGDQIISINGFNVETASGEELDDLFKRCKADGTVTLMLRYNPERLRDIENAWQAGRESAVPDDITPMSPTDDEEDASDTSQSNASPGGESSTSSSAEIARAMGAEMKLEKME